MPLPALLMYGAPAALSVGQTLMNLGSLKRSKPPLGEHTFSGRFLAERAKSGMYSPEVRSRIMSGVGRDLGALAQRARSDISGGLASTGMRNSIAGQRLLSQPARDMSGSLSDVASRLDIENEQSKQTAEYAYNQLKDESRNARRGWRSQMNQTAWGGALNTLGAGLGGYQQHQQNQNIGPGITKAQELMSAGKIDEANALVNMLILQYMGGM
jgi:hypothetical protein